MRRPHPGSFSFGSQELHTNWKPSNFGTVVLLTPTVGAAVECWGRCAADADCWGRRRVLGPRLPDRQIAFRLLDYQMAARLANCWIARLLRASCFMMRASFLSVSYFVLRFMFKYIHASNLCYSYIVVFLIVS